jgi:hypothetical protein
MASLQREEHPQVHKHTSSLWRHFHTSKDILSRAKYQFEPDSDDEELEDVIECTVDEIAGVAQQLKGVALTQGEELQQHDGRLDWMRRTADKVDDGLASKR